MKPIHLLFAIFIFLTACQQETPEIIPGHYLPKQTFTIRTGVDTTLKTKGGIIILISKTSFSEAGKVIDLNVREALTKGDMVLGNLPTVDQNGRLLESDGMFQISTDSDVTLNKTFPLRLKIPTDTYSNEMKRFAGVWEDGRLTWGQEKELVASDFSQSIKRGEQLFKTLCSSCHNKNMRDDMTGPALGNISKFRSEEYLYRFIRNSSELIASGNVIANCIYNSYNKSVMTAYPNLTDGEIEYILDFIESESRNQEIALDEVTYLTDCEYRRIGGTEYRIEKNYVLDENGNPTDEIASIDTITIPTPAIPSPIRQAFYEVNINSYDWYNIDRYRLIYKNKPIENIVFELENVPGQLHVRAFLVFKNENTVLTFYSLGKNTFALNYQKQAKIEFPEGATLTAHFWCKKGEKVYMGTKEIITKEVGNQYKISLEEVTWEQLRAAQNAL